MTHYDTDAHNQFADAAHRLERAEQDIRDLVPAVLMPAVRSEFPTVVEIELWYREEEGATATFYAADYKEAADLWSGSEELRELFHQVAPYAVSGDGYLTIRA